MIPAGTTFLGDWHSHILTARLSPGDDALIDSRILTIPNYQGHFLATPQGLVLFQNQLSVLGVPPVVVYPPGR